MKNLASNLQISSVKDENQSQKISARAIATASVPPKTLQAITGLTISLRFSQSFLMFSIQAILLLRIVAIARVICVLLAKHKAFSVSVKTACSRLWQARKCTKQPHFVSTNKTLLRFRILHSEFSCVGFACMLWTRPPFVLSPLALPPRQ